MLFRSVENQGTRDTTLTGYFKANANPTEEYLPLCIRTFLLNLYGKLETESGQKGKQRTLLLVACTMHIQTLGNSFTFVHCFVLLKMLHHNGVVHPTFQAACLAQGLLEDDNEWRKCLLEAANMASGHQLHNLFVTILRDCSPLDPLALWLEFRETICD